MERVIYRNPDTGFSIAHVQVDSSLVNDSNAPPSRITVRGNCPSIAAGFRLEMHGRMVEDDRRGETFYVDRSVNKEVQRMRMTDLAELDPQDVIDLLSSGMFKRIGWKTAERIVRRFGASTVRVLDDEETAVEMLVQVPRIGRKIAEELSKTWTKLRRSELTLQLVKMQIPLVYSQRIVRRYGDHAVEAIQRNPYRLVEDLPRFRFEDADAIALRLGLSRVSENRLRAAVCDVLQRSANGRGHCYLEQEDLIRVTLGRCGLRMGDAKIHVVVREILQRMVQDAGLHMRGNSRFYLPELYWMEWRFTSSICERMAHLEGVVPNPEYANSRLSEEQFAAVKLMLASQVSILSGSPGSGKTFCLHAVTQEWTRQGKRILLACPTARAAKRLEASTRLKAMTIHRALEYSPSYWTEPDRAQLQSGGEQQASSAGFYDSIGQYFARDRYNKLEVDAVIIDETSMLDLGLGTALLEAIPTHAQLIFVGDYNQLPSVGPGRLFRDLVESAFIPTVTLNKSFRQAGGVSGVITQEAERIRTGKVPLRADLPFEEQKERQLSGDDRLLWLTCEDENDCTELILGTALNIVQEFGFDPLEDVQVLSPMNQGSSGTIELNKALRDRFNPRHNDSAAPLVFANNEYRVGDRVMQKVNNYNLGVFNGTLGTIRAVDPVAETITVAFQEVNSFHVAEEDASDEPILVTYEKWKIPSNVILSYACTVHKSQGSEYPAVIIPVFNSHHHLNRSMLYTAVTRAKQLVIILGQREALERAVQKLDNLDRNTTLQTLLQDGLVSNSPTLNFRPDGTRITTTWDLEHLRKCWDALFLDDI